jgi:hypothetical protein
MPEIASAATSGACHHGCLQPWRAVFRDAGLVVAGCGLVALATNAVRAGGIPLIQQEDYAILVPCPETVGHVDAIDPRMALPNGSRILWIDARGRQDYGEWHAPGAWNLTFDYLAPSDPAAVARVASSGAREVVVYGDGQDPDSGEQLARELAGKGIRSVRFIAGGAPALRDAQSGGSGP